MNNTTTVFGSTILHANNIIYINIDSHKLSARITGFTANGGLIVESLSHVDGTWRGSSADVKALVEDSFYSNEE